MTHQAARTASHALMDVSNLASHNELTTLAGNFGWLLSKSLALSPSVAKALSLQMVEIMDAIDQDLVNQQAEQSWNEAQTRAAGFALTPADHALAEIAGIRKQPLEIRA